MTERAVRLPVLPAVRVDAADQRSAAILPLFVSTIFLGAFLLFLVEPMIARMVLPVLGGTPMVWNTCVLFFQITLLGGYAFVHGLARIAGAKRRAAVYSAIVLAPLLTLPFALRGAENPPATGNPIPWLLGVLIASIGLPFFALSASGPLLQKLFSRTTHQSARDPYFLYAASNIGSLLALVAYPALVEPAWRLNDQARLWALGYLVFAACALACMVVGSRGSLHDAPAAVPAQVDVEPLSWRRRLRWLALAFVPSTLLLAVTSYLTTDIAAVPLLWIVPLALYLLTFILAFGARGAAWQQMADRRLPLAIVALVTLMILQIVGPPWLVIPVHLTAFTLGGLLCHCRLAGDRPSTSRLTEFYFWISFGGMLGGVFNTLVAPLIFSTIAEYPIAVVLVAACRYAGPPASTVRRDRVLDIAVPLAIGLLTVVMVALGYRVGAIAPAALVVPVIAAFSQARRPERFAAGIAALVLAGLLTPGTRVEARALYRERTFFGVYRVGIDLSGRYRTLAHGTTLHGMQAIDRAHEHEPLTYFHRTGPFGQAFTTLPRATGASEVAVVGLGAGTLASYATPRQRWTFYEIDPAVERIARTRQYFTYLEACGDRCRVVLGDARLSLAHTNTQYDVFVLDAFSSDAIPVHLITSEAVSLYLSRLAPQGLLFFHISNRHLALGPILGQLAKANGLIALEQIDLLGDGPAPDGKSSSDWVVMARSTDDLAPLLGDRRWTRLEPQPSTPLWTDDFSNILGVMTLVR